MTAVSALPAHAQPRSQDDIARRLEELARLRSRLAERETDVRGNIAEAASVRQALTDELSELQSIVDEVQNRVAAASSTLSSLQKRVDTKDAVIRHAEGVLEKKITDLQDRAKFVYKRGPAAYFDIVLGVKNLGQLLRGLALMTHVADQDNRQITEVENVKAAITKERDEIKELRDKAAEQVAVVAAERDRASSIANQVAGRREAVVGKLQSSFAELGNIEAQRAQYDRETAGLQAESSAIAAFLRGRGSGPAQVSPKGMTWPASGPVTSGFGWREHPVLGGRRFHAGIDIGAPHSSAVVAAGTGTVIFVGPKNGYGNTVIIDHGGGIATLYGHQSAIGVDNGVPVSIGQRVGSVGCTGYCTGPHLHFEVRVNGDPVDPMGWLP